MATGRTVTKHWRVYADGYDLSGYSRSIGPLGISFAEEGGDAPALTDAVKGVLPGQGTVMVGTLNAIFDNTATSGLHAVMNAVDQRDIMVAMGIRAAPAQGDPIFVAQSEQTAYVPEADGMMGVTIPFGAGSARATTMLFAKPFGVLLHAKGAETAVNSAVGVDDWGAQTTLGGYMMYHAFTSNGTATIKVQDASTNSDGSFGDLLSSGVIDPSSSPLSGIVATATGATVKRYLRWQIVLGTATTVTFALGFVRITV